MSICIYNYLPERSKKLEIIDLLVALKRSKSSMNRLFSDYDESFIDMKPSQFFSPAQKDDVIKYYDMTDYDKKIRYKVAVWCEQLLKDLAGPPNFRKDVTDKMIKDLNDCEPAECYQLDSAVRELAADPLLIDTVNIYSTSVFFELYRKQVDRLNELEPQFISLLDNNEIMPNCQTLQDLDTTLNDVNNRIRRLLEIARLVPVDQYEYNQLEEERNRTFVKIVPLSDRARALCKLGWSFEQARRHFPNLDSSLKMDGLPDHVLLEAARDFRRTLEGQFEQTVGSVIKKLEDIETYKFITTSRDKDLVIGEIRKANPEVRKYLTDHVILWESQDFDGHEINSVIQTLPEL